MTALEDLIR